MSLFNKTTAPAPAAPRRKAAPKASPVVITGLGLACHAGEEPYALISSVLGQMSGVAISEEYAITLNNGKAAMPRMAPVVEIGNQTSSTRVTILASSALKRAVAQLPTTVDPAKISILVMHDKELVSDTESLKRYLIDGMRHLSSSTFRFLNKQSILSTSAVRQALEELKEGKWLAVIFGGCDSLISMETCLDLHDAGRLNTVGNTEGIVPGEAAAFVVLQNKDLAEKNATPILAYLRGVGVGAEPHARDADLKTTEGMANAIGQALMQAGIEASDVQGIVHSLGAETVQSLEWYQTTQAIWPRRVSEQQRIAVQNGEIEQADIPEDPIPQTLLPYMTVGEVGAAALPMQIATALAWMEYDAWQARMGFPIRENILICDTPDAPERGALVISTKLAAA